MSFMFDRHPVHHGGKAFSKLKLEVEGGTDEQIESLQKKLYVVLQEVVNAL